MFVGDVVLLCVLRGTNYCEVLLKMLCLLEMLLCFSALAGELRFRRGAAISQDASGLGASKHQLGGLVRELGGAKLGDRFC